jgi:hypothetical protein
MADMYLKSGGSDEWHLMAEEQGEIPEEFQRHPRRGGLKLTKCGKWILSRPFPEPLDGESTVHCADCK